MSPTTEILILKLKDSSEILEGSGTAARTWRNAVDELLTPDGARCVHWGTVLENPSWVRVFIEWDSLEHCMRFHPTDAFASFAEKTMTVFSDKILVAHAQLEDFEATARDAFNAPATELLSIFFPADYTDIQAEVFEAGMRRFLQHLMPEAKAARGAAGGWVTEVLPPDLTWPSTDRKTYFLCIGWESVEDHMKVRSTQAFKDNIHLIRGADGFQDLLNMHFHGQEAVQQ